MSDESNKVRVVDFDMPFWSMVEFMLKWAIATIPALIILMIFGFFAAVVIGVMADSAGIS